MLLPTVISPPEPRPGKDPALDPAELVYPAWWVPDDAMLVESDLTLTHNIMACLARRGHHIRWAASTQMAATLACVVRLPRVIFTDLERPTLDPLEWLRQVRHNEKTANTLAICGPGASPPDAANVVAITGFASLPLTAAERFWLQALRVGAVARQGPLI